MEAPSFCTSIRKRPDWAPLVSALLQSSGTLRWKGVLQSHDVAMPLPPKDGRSKSVLRAILLCPQEIGSDATHQRIERLYHLDGGQHVVIVFMMKESRSGSAAASLMRLQLDLMNGLEMPIIPVSSIDAVPATLLAFHRQLATAGGGKKTLPASRSLLPHCSGAENLSEHSANVLSDVTTGMKDLSEKATSEQGKQELIRYLGEAEAERAISFWNDEFPMD
ncbi:hypothetical protein PG993_006842 [Apiospora rasikravindrae]|uniref:Uncharacterized protein n=1 Tax=Apiospora rasikravindrae TaxID=990691 RepID=A0ABR1T909_9PEZI